jgi:hypothetical protein
LTPEERELLVKQFFQTSPLHKLPNELEANFDSFVAISYDFFLKHNVRWK